MELADTKEDIVVASDICDPISSLVHLPPSPNRLICGFFHILKPYKLLQAMVRGIIAHQHLLPSRIFMNAPFHQRSRLLWHNPSLGKRWSSLSPFMRQGFASPIYQANIIMVWWYYSPTQDVSHCCPRYVNHQLFRTKSNSIIVVIPAVPPSTAYLL